MEYYYIVMSQKDMLKNQVLEEILRERANYYFSKNRSLDFWVTISPSFLENKNIFNKIKETNFYKQHKSEIQSDSENEFYCALITLNKDFLNWIKLRLGYFENLDDLKLMDSNFASDGIFGTLDKNINSPLKNKENFLNPEILTNRYKKMLNLYYLAK